MSGIEGAKWIGMSSMLTKARFSGRESFPEATMVLDTFSFRQMTLIAYDEAIASGAGEPLITMRMFRYFPMVAANACGDESTIVPHLNLNIITLTSLVCFLFFMKRLKS